MAITRITSGLVTSASSAAESSRAITLPTVVDDDFAVAVLGFITASAPTITPPAGWNNDLALIRPGTGTFRLGVWSKKLTAAESAGTPSWGSSVSGQITAVCRIYRGVDATIPWEVTPTSATLGTTDSTPDCPDITTNIVGAEVIAAYAVGTTANTNWTDWAAPSGLGDASNACSTVASVNNVAIGTSALLTVASGATGVMTATTGPTGTPQARLWAAVSMALRPTSTALPTLQGGWGIHL